MEKLYSFRPKSSVCSELITWLTKYNRKWLGDKYIKSSVYNFHKDCVWIVNKY